MLRIEAGLLGGRVLRPLPSGPRVRPTAAKVRAALCDRLQNDIVGARVLDVFAGSGAVSIEAISRGAAFALQLERQRVLVRRLRVQIEELGLGSQVEVVAGDAVTSLRRGRQTRAPFDLVVLDPPYDRTDLAEQAAAALIEGRWLSGKAMVVCERPLRRGVAPPCRWPAELEIEARRTYGQTLLEYLRLRMDVRCRCEGRQ